MDPKILKEATLAYQAVYDEDLRAELEEQQEFENWVNSLVEEGYDLSEYTWEEMYEAYIDEAPNLGTGGTAQDMIDKKRAAAKPQPQMKGLSIGKGGFNVGGKPVKTGMSPIFQRPGAKPAAAKPAPTAAAKPAATTSAAAKPAAAKPAPTAPAAKPYSGSGYKKDTSITDMIGRSQIRQGAPINTGNKSSDIRSMALRGTSTGGSSSSTTSTPKPMMNKATGSRKPGSIVSGFDMFDIVKGYLIGEGYADTEDAAIAIMANMSEDWKTVIMSEARAEGVKPYKAGPTQAEVRADAKKAREKHVEKSKGQKGYGDEEKFKSDWKLRATPSSKTKRRDGTEETVSQRMDREKPYGKRMTGQMAREYGSRHAAEVTRVVKGAGEPQAVTYPRKGRDEKPKASREIVRRSKQEESLELYNLVLSHLINEGYASDLENAEAMVESMSDEWILSIIG